MEMKDNKREILGRAFLIRYTLLFLITFFGVFLWFFLTGRTFIWCADGLTQHYNALIFYGDHLRNVLRTVFVEHSLNIPSWSFSIGEGGDILDVFHYYAIGDPLCAFSVFFNAGNMYILYCLIVAVKLYLSGLTFSYLCKVTGQKSFTGVLTGSMSYVFCYFAIYNSARHYFFLTPMVLLPLLLAGTEKVIKREKPYLLTVVVFLAAISQFYFFYMMVIMTVVYTAVRLIILYGKDIRKWLSVIRDMVIFSLTGVLMSGVVFLPVLAAFTGDGRSSGVNALRLIYPMSYYADLPGLILTPDNTFWLCLCFTSTAVVALLLLFLRKGELKSAKVFAVICLVFMLIPFFGQMFNGMSYMSNRWSFSVALLVSYVLASEFDLLLEAGSLYRKGAPVILAVLIMSCALTGHISDPDVIASLVVLGLFILLMAFLPKRYDSPKTRAGIILAFTIISVLVSAFYLFSAAGDNYAAETRRPSEISDYYDDDGTAAYELLKDEGSFYRYSGSGVQLNSALNKDVSSVLYYWTISNPYCIEFNNELCLGIYDMNKYPNFDDRTVMTDLGSVLYYIVPEGYEAVPYGYALTDSSIYPGHDIYVNEDPIGLCFTSDSLISRSYWDGLSPSMKEEALLHGVVVEEDISSGLPVITPGLSTVEPDLTYSCDESEVSIGGGSIDVTGDAAVVRLEFSGIPGSETHITFKGLTYNDGMDTAVVVKSSSGILKVLDLHEDGYEYYNGRHDFTIDLGYCDDPQEWVVFAFTEKGSYSYDSISVSCIPMDGTFDRIDELKSEAPSDVAIGTDEVTCPVDLSSPQMLVFTIPYSTGWTASVDGEKAELIRADVKYMALDLPSGHHDIVLSYHTPMFAAGEISSLFGLVLFAGEVKFLKKREKITKT